MAKISRELKSPSLAIDGTHDHVHMLFLLARVITVADLVEELKTSTSIRLGLMITRLQRSTWGVPSPGALPQALTSRTFGARQASPHSGAAKPRD